MNGPEENPEIPSSVRYSNVAGWRIPLQMVWEVLCQHSVIFRFRMYKPEIATLAAFGNAAHNTCSTSFPLVALGPQQLQVDTAAADCWIGMIYVDPSKPQPQIATCSWGNSLEASNFGGIHGYPIFRQSHGLARPFHFLRVPAAHWEVPKFYDLKTARSGF